MSVGLMTSSDLIEAVKRRAFLPNAQNTLDENDILAFINEELKDSVIPLIMSMREEYFLFPINIPIIANKNNYKIPYRAIGMKLRDVRYIDVDGTIIDMTRIDIADRSHFQRGQNLGIRTFYIRGDELVFGQDVGQTPQGNIETMIYLSPNQLVKENRVGKVLSINSTTGEITLDKLPSNIALNTEIDLLEYKQGNRTLKFDIPVLAVNSFTKTITIDPSNISSDLVVGDIIASAGECIIPQIPVEMHSILAERAAARCLASMGDTQGLGNSNAKIGEMETKVASMINDRTEGNPKKINNTNGILRRSRISRKRFVG